VASLQSPLAGLGAKAPDFDLPGTPHAARELFDAMVQIARTGRGPSSQTPSVGCSIKWKRS